LTSFDQKIAEETVLKSIRLPNDNHGVPVIGEQQIAKNGGGIKIN
jgi:hypothetical protein